MTIAKFACVTVSSRRMRISPALTRSPSRARTSPTTPPLGCWTFLTLESTTSEPCAMIAPEISAVEAQPPSPTPRNATSAQPTMMWRRIEAREFRDALLFIDIPQMSSETAWTMADMSPSV